MIGNSNDVVNFPNKLLLVDTLILRFHKTFTNVLSAKIKLSKGQLSKMVKLGDLRLKC